MSLQTTGATKPKLEEGGQKTSDVNPITNIPIEYDS